MKKSYIATFALALAAAGVVGTAGAAIAGSSLCPAARVCIYVNDQFVGLMTYRGAGGALANLSSNLNDQMTSWENKTSTNGAWYYDINGGGTCRDLYSNSENSNVGASDNDQMSSWRTNGHC